VYKSSSFDNLETILSLISGKWKIYIINELLKKDLRFSEIKKRIGCTSKMLTLSLKELESAGLVERVSIETPTAKVLYTLTEIGGTLFPVIDSLQAWGRDYKKLRKLQTNIKSK